MKVNGKENASSNVDVTARNVQGNKGNKQFKRTKHNKPGLESWIWINILYKTGHSQKKEIKYVKYQWKPFDLKIY